MSDGFVALYIFMLAAIAGHVIISRVPVILHTPLMSGSNFIHGIVLIGAMVVLGHAQTPLEKALGFLPWCSVPAMPPVATWSPRACWRCSSRARQGRQGRTEGATGLNISTVELLDWLVKASYLVAATLFLLGLQRMASPLTARSGIRWAGLGMLLATVATFFLPELHNVPLILVALLLGAGLAWWSARWPSPTCRRWWRCTTAWAVVRYAAIGAVELLRYAFLANRDTRHWSEQALADLAARQPSGMVLLLAVVGAAIGAVSLSGSVIAWAKLDGRLDKRVTWPGQQVMNLMVALVVAVLAIIAASTLNTSTIVAFFVLALALGVLMTLPIGGADMPVVISLYNAFTGLAVSFEGYVLGNEALIIAGMMVGAVNILLTRLMAKAMNRPIRNVLFSNFGGGAGGEAQAITGAQKPIEASDVAAMMAFAERVVIVPGYGMAVAQAQHKIWELAQRLGQRGVKVKFAIHPVAGRMPGHMNVLLAEAGVPYDLIADMDDINPEFANTDVVLVIGANDVVNPVARTDPASPIYGMPVLDVVNARNVVVIKRGKGTGFAGIENALFYADNTRMLYGDGAEAAASLVSELKALDGGIEDVPVAPGHARRRFVRTAALAGHGPALPSSTRGVDLRAQRASQAPTATATASHSHSTAPLARLIRVQARCGPIRVVASHRSRPIEPPIQALAMAQLATAATSRVPSTTRATRSRPGPSVPRRSMNTSSRAASTAIQPTCR